jgi:hypothetical protein
MPTKVRRLIRLLEKSADFILAVESQSLMAKAAKFILRFERNALDKRRSKRERKFWSTNAW